MSLAGLAGRTAKLKITFTSMRLTQQSEWELSRCQYIANDPRADSPNRHNPSGADPKRRAAVP